MSVVYLFHWTRACNFLHYPSQGLKLVRLSNPFLSIKPLSCKKKNTWWRNLEGLNKNMTFGTARCVMSCCRFCHDPSLFHLAHGVRFYARPTEMICTITINLQSRASWVDSLERIIMKHLCFKSKKREQR